MAQALARYDGFAEWYEQWIGDTPPLIAAHSGLLPAVTGERVLDIACGQGRMSRYLARLGADVVGVDISAGMLDKARAIGPEDIAYLRADVAGHPAWWDGRPFGGCTCEMALMDIDDLDERSASGTSAVASRCTGVPLIRRLVNSEVDVELAAGFARCLGQCIAGGWPRGSST